MMRCGGGSGWGKKGGLLHEKAVEGAGLGEKRSSALVLLKVSGDVK